MAFTRSLIGMPRLMPSTRCVLAMRGLPCGAARGHGLSPRQLVATLVAPLWLAACGGTGDSVTIRGDVAGLDTLALRGDSLIAQAERAPATIDSLRAASQEEFRRQLADSFAKLDLAPRATGAPGDAPPGTSPGTAPGDAPRAVPPTAAATGRNTAGGVMSRRAQARGDSMARAYAAQLAGGSGGDRSRPDSARGVLVWQGAEPTRMVVLRTADGLVSLSGMATMGLGRLAGSEVVVRGVRVSPRDLVMTDYFVRAADGVPAFDGVIQPDGTLRLTDGGGAKRVPLPASMQGLVGARVWVAVKDGAPVAYGLIQVR